MPPFVSRSSTTRVLSRISSTRPLMDAARTSGEVGVGAGQERAGHLDDGHARAERGVDSRHLEADVPAADDEQAPGDLGQLERRRRVPDAVRVDLERPRDRAGREPVATIA